VPASNGINATFDIDLLGLKSLSMGDEEKRFLLALALWKVAAFLSNKPAFDARSRQTSPSLRLREDCYLSCGDSVRWSGNGSAKLSEILGALPAQKPDFDKLAEAQGFKIATDGDGKPHLIKVAYPKRGAAAAATPPSASADAPQFDEQPQTD
jgi:hypothetical protein